MRSCFPLAGKNRIALDFLGAERATVDAALSVSGLKGMPAARPNCSFQPTAGFGALLIVGTGDGTSPTDAAEKLGGAVLGTAADVRRNAGRARPHAVSTMTRMRPPGSRLRPRFGHGATTATGPSSRTSRSRPSRN